MPYNCWLSLQSNYCHYNLYMNFVLTLNTFRPDNYYNCRCRCLPNTFRLHNHNIVMNLLVRIFRRHTSPDCLLRSDNNNLPSILYTHLMMLNLHSGYMFRLHIVDMLPHFPLNTFPCRTSYIRFDLSHLHSNRHYIPYSSRLRLLNTFRLNMPYNLQNLFLHMFRPHIAYMFHPMLPL